MIFTSVIISHSILWINLYRLLHNLLWPPLFFPIILTNFLANIYHDIYLGYYKLQHLMDYSLSPLYNLLRPPLFFPINLMNFLANIYHDIYLGYYKLLHKYHLILGLMCNLQLLFPTIGDLNEHFLVKLTLHNTSIIKAKLKFWASLKHLSKLINRFLITFQRMKRHSYSNFLIKYLSSTAPSQL